MFTVPQRDVVRGRLLALADADPAIPAAAITGSGATGTDDQWSDIDLALATSDPVPTVLRHWTELLYRDFGALHHWDLPAEPTVYRVFLLPDGLEVDLGFTPVADFGPLGPQWRLVFGATSNPVPAAGPATDERWNELTGLAWHHVLHARACIERAKPWQAAWLIGALHEHVLALACLRAGLPTRYAKGADLLPVADTEPVADSLVGSLDEAELRRALAAATRALVAELRLDNPALAERLHPVLAEATDA